MSSPDLRAPEVFTRAFPYAATTSFDATNPDDTALALATATTTGQTVEHQ